MELTFNDLPQKVRGLVYLAQTDSWYGDFSLHATVVVYPGDTEDTLSVLAFAPGTRWRLADKLLVEQFNSAQLYNALYQILALYSTQVFIRPCPTQPRHGFVDSRPMDISVSPHGTTFSNIKEILNEARAVDPGACLMIMPFIEADASMIATPYGIAVGPGHDGATSGRDSIYFPLGGSNEMTKAPENRLFAVSNTGNTIKLDDVITDTPYIEVVYGSQRNTYSVVQLRDGQQPPSGTGNFIPQFVNGKHRVWLNTDDTPDLVAWETLMAAANPDVVAVFHPGGTRVSHYAHHAIAHGIPVIFDSDPKVMELCFDKTDDVIEIDRVAFIDGFTYGLVDELTPKLARNRLYAVMIAAHSACLGDSEDMSALVGYGIASLIRLGSAATLGETRHIARYIQNKRSSSRETVYNRVMTVNKLADVMRLRNKVAAAKDTFCHPVWRGGYGGLSWARCAQSIVDLIDTVSTAIKSQASLTSTIVPAFHRALNQAHNNGWWLNKFAGTHVGDAFANNHLDEYIKGARAGYYAVRSIRAARTVGPMFALLRNEVVAGLSRARSQVNQYTIDYKPFFSTEELDSLQRRFNFHRVCTSTEAHNCISEMFGSDIDNYIRLIDSKQYALTSYEIPDITAAVSEALARVRAHPDAGNNAYTRAQSLEQRVQYLREGSSQTYSDVLREYSATHGVECALDGVLLDYTQLYEDIQKLARGTEHPRVMGMELGRAFRRHHRMLRFSTLPGSLQNDQSKKCLLIIQRYDVHEPCMLRISTEAVMKESDEARAVLTSMIHADSHTLAVCLSEVTTADIEDLDIKSDFMFMKGFLRAMS